MLPERTNPIIRIIVAVLLLCLLPIGVWAETEQEPAVQSAVLVKGYPSPIVPLCDRVDDSYFEDVVLVGDSLCSAIPHYKAMPAMEIIYKIGLSPISVAKDDEVFFPNGRDKPGITLIDALVERNPRVVYLWMGLNGIEGNAASYVLPYYHTMLNRLIEALPNTLFCILEVSPVSNEAVYKKGALTNKNVNAFNDGLYELAQAHNIYILQIHDMLVGRDDAIANEYMAADGIHLSRTGYNEVVDYLYMHALPLESVIWPGDAP